MKNGFLVLVMVLSLVAFVTQGCVANPLADNTASNGQTYPSDFDTGISMKQALKGDKPIIVKFYADWCGACRRAAPVFDAVRKNHADEVEFVMVNVDTNSALADDYNVRLLPTVFYVNPKTQDKKKIDSGTVFNKNAFEKYVSNLH